MKTKKVLVLTGIVLIAIATAATLWLLFRPAPTDSLPLPEATSISGSGGGLTKPKIISSPIPTVSKTSCGGMGCSAPATPQEPGWASIENMPSRCALVVAENLPETSYPQWDGKPVATGLVFNSVADLSCRAWVSDYTKFHQYR